jgi:hypothetical protein
MRYPPTPDAPLPDKAHAYAIRCGQFLVRRIGPKRVRVVDEAPDRPRFVEFTIGACTLQEACKAATARPPTKWSLVPSRSGTPPGPRATRTQNGERVELQLPTDVVKALDRRAKEAGLSRAGWFTDTMRKAEAKAAAKGTT